MYRFNGQLLQQRRKAAGCRREGVALAIGKSAETISAYERGLIDPPASVVGRLAAALDCAPGDLYDGGPVVRQAVMDAVGGAPPLTMAQAAALRAAGFGVERSADA